VGDQLTSGVRKLRQWATKLAGLDMWSWLQNHSGQEAGASVRVWVLRWLALVQRQPEEVAHHIILFFLLLCLSSAVDEIS
jgi:hypothetical protein